MRVVRLQGVEFVELVTAAEPELVAGSVIVEIDRCGIGGSDVEAYQSGVVPAPAWFGHEWVGRVVAVGADARDRFEGERVVGAAPPACGHCAPCWAGHGAHCQTVLQMIVGTDSLAGNHGAFAERIRVDARRVHRVPEGIDDNDAALAEPASVAAHALARGGVGIGDMVAVIGAGTIGLLVAEFARLAGAARVAALDTASARRELACDLGADAAFGASPEFSEWLGRTGHRLGADVVFDCAGTEDSLAQAIELSRQGGTVVTVGVANVASGIVPASLIEREVTVRASLGYTVGDVGRALVLMAEDRLRVAPLLDPNPVGLEAVPGVLADLAGTKAGRSKVLVRP